VIFIAAVIDNGPKVYDQWLCLPKSPQAFKDREFSFIFIDMDKNGLSA
jgi:hypothetical protein